MRPKYPLRAFDGATTSDVQQLNVPAGAIDANGEIDLGQGIKVYRALLTQSGTDAPVATVLENTLGFTPTWTYNEAGIYSLQMADTVAFPVAKTVINITNNAELVGDPFAVITARRVDDATLRVNTLSVDVASGTCGLANDVLVASYEVLVYP